MENQQYIGGSSPYYTKITEIYVSEYGLKVPCTSDEFKQALYVENDGEYSEGLMRLFDVALKQFDCDKGGRYSGEDCQRAVFAAMAVENDIAS